MVSDYRNRVDVDEDDDTDEIDEIQKEIIGFDDD